MLANPSLFGKPYSLAQGRLLIIEVVHAIKTKHLGPWKGEHVLLHLCGISIHFNKLK
jgi:hypothetical protein